MTTEPQPIAHSFWSRPEIQSAQRALDVWGTTKKHWRLGGRGIPILDWIDMKDERFVILEKRGRQWIEEGKNPAFQSFGKLSPAFLLVLGVDAVLGELGNPVLLHALMIHRYPVDGPLAHTEAQRSLRRFWSDPENAVGYKWACQTVGCLRGRYTAKTVDQLLAQMERDFLDYLVLCGVRR